MSQLALFSEPRGSARFSGDRKHRYELTRQWADGPRLCAIMLNPSKAGAVKNDPTVRKWMGFVSRWNRRVPHLRRSPIAELVVVNLYSLVSPEPADVRAAGLDAAAGDPDNLEAIVEAARSSAVVVAAWGAQAAQWPGGRDRQVVDALDDLPLHCIKRTGQGHPGHPLYLPYDLDPVPWKPPWISTPPS